MPVRLRVLTGPLAGTIYFLAEGEGKVFGRSTTADVRVHDALVSRHHIMVRGSAAGGILFDLDSSNGTFLNGRLVKESSLETGDQIKVGSTTFEVSVERRAREAPPEAGDRVETKRALVFCTRCLRATTAPEGEEAAVAPPWEPFVCDQCKGKATGSPLDAALIDGYKLVEKVGQDPRGPLYRADQLALGRAVLVRVFAPLEGAVESRALEMFLREAQLAGRLTHANIVETLDAGECRGVYYIVEEWIAGQDLEERLKAAKGPLPLEEALEIAARVAAALDYVHGQGIVHRNVRPTSIFLGEYGKVKLGDFGSARPISPKASGSGITKPGEWRGQANYSPPELLLSASPVDQRADIYSLGATCYHMVTGHTPFEAPTAMKVIRRIGEGELTAIASLNPAAPPAVRALIERCLEREPKQRFAAPRELLQAIEQCRAKLGPGGK